MAENSELLTVEASDEIRFCTFRVFLYGARTKNNPRVTRNFEIHGNGRVDIRSIENTLQIGELFLWTEKGDIIYLGKDLEGWSRRTFNHRCQYDIKAKAKVNYHRSENFSTVLWETVQRDFNIEVEEDGTWDVGTPSIVPEGVPESLKEQLQLLSTRHTFRAEAARRLVVSLLVVNAMSHVDGGQTRPPFLALDDEFNLRELRDTGNDVVQYAGSPDFIVGHSRTPAGLLKNTALVIIEAKKGANLNSQMAQVLSQASVILDLRRQHQPRRGHGEYKTYWLLSDGINWTAGYVRPGAEEKILYGFSFTKRATLTPFHKSEFDAVFEMLCALLELAKLSTPRGSTVDLHQDQEQDIDIALAALEISAEDSQGNERAFGDEDETEDVPLGTSKYQTGATIGLAENLH